MKTSPKQKLQMNEDKSKEFLLEFFKDSKIKDEKGILTIEEVPADFEKFVGKKSPYKFVFDISLHDKVKDSELIMQGSYFLLAIRDYLSDKGQTSLLKINIQPDREEISKNPKLKKYKILEIKPGSIDFLYEFSFLSTYQYLNDKKQTSSTILVKDNQVLDTNLAEFKIQKGNRDEIPILDPSKEYRVAKKRLNENVSKEIRPIKLILRKKLEKELFRVKDHYFKQIKEKDEEVETCANKIRLLQSKLRHTSYERDRNIIIRMIHESEQRLEMLKKQTYKERLRAEEIFHINDEVEKHVLSIKNNLINVSVFYYPLLDLYVSIKGKKGVLKYDPILKKIL